MTKNILLLKFILIFFLGLGINACTASESSGNPANLLTPGALDNATRGHIVPIRFAELSFPISGKVVEVLVSEGQQIKTGDVIARLVDNQASADLTSAGQDVQNAQQALDGLQKNIDLSRAQILQEIADAHFTISQDQYNLDNLTLPPNQIGLDPIMAITKVQTDKLDKAQQAYESCKAGPTDGNCESLKSNLSVVQEEYRIAIRRLQYEAEKARAEAQLAHVQQVYENMKDGPDPDAVAIAEATLNNALAALQVAQEAMDATVLRAPADFMVVELDLQAGQKVSADQVVAFLADLSQWVVETDNLTEVQASNISVGDHLTVVPQAVSGVSLEGVVESISKVGKEKDGKVIYNTKITLLESPPELRWGMTVVIKIK
jgi:multidrug resistance efflux pump